MLTTTGLFYIVGNIENYNDTLGNIHTSLYQVLRLTNMRKFSRATKWMCQEIQKYGEAVIYDSPQYLEETISEGMVVLHKR